jgi:UDP-N-acetylmuramyl pentapeptide synthase
MTKYALEGALLVDMPAEAICCCKDHLDIAGRLHQAMKEGDVFLFKGSRGMTMEKAATELKRLIKGE